MKGQPAWDEAWLATSVIPMSMFAWRGVEAQHAISTMRLVDSLGEQDVLEGLLEQSKPALPSMKLPKHYLLSTPFRYRPEHPSRFRAAGSLGVWYGSEDLIAACAEVAYWRHRFIMDSDSLADDELLTEHTFFQARVSGAAVNLLAQPWVAANHLWTHPTDYSATQGLAALARDRGVQWICYGSVRAPGHRCAAVLHPDGLVDLVAHGTTQQTWHCRTTRKMVMFAHGGDRHEWQF